MFRRLFRGLRAGRRLAVPSRRPVRCLLRRTACERNAGGIRIPGWIWGSGYMQTAGCARTPGCLRMPGGARIVRIVWMARRAWMIARRRVTVR